MRMPAISDEHNWRKVSCIDRIRKLAFVKMTSTISLKTNKNGRKTTAEEGSRWIDIDEEERLSLERDIEVLQKRICEFEVCMMQMDAAVEGMIVRVCH